MPTNAPTVPLALKTTTRVDVKSGGPPRKREVTRIEELDAPTEPQFVRYTGRGGAGSKPRVLRTPKSQPDLKAKGKFGFMRAKPFNATPYGTGHRSEEATQSKPTYESVARHRPPPLPLNRCPSTDTETPLSTPLAPDSPFTPSASSFLSVEPSVFDSEQNQQVIMVSRRSENYGRSPINWMPSGWETPTSHTPNCATGDQGRTSGLSRSSSGVSSFTDSTATCPPLFCVSRPPSSLVSSSCLSGPIAFRDMNEESTETVPEDVLPHFLGHPRRVPDKASTDSRCVSPLRPVTTREGGQRQTTWRGEWNEEDIAEVMHKLRILR